MIEALIALYERDLEKLKAELSLYKNEDELWLLAEGISNTAGNLALHIVGNLNNFIGAKLGNTGYVRDRPAEFSSKVSREVLHDQISETILMVQKTLKNLDITILETDYPEEVFGYKMKTDFFIIHLHSHLNYHLGQINYHRRLVCYK
jgi:hypothetical protein